MAVPHLRVRIQDRITSEQIKLKYDKALTDRQMYEQENEFSKSTGIALQQYYIEFKNYYNTQRVGSNCNDITFTNLGSNPVVISSAITLQQNQSLQIGGNQNELDTTEYIVTFTTLNSPNNNLLVIRKLYK
jgi:hypothetical protein